MLTLKKYKQNQVISFETYLSSLYFSKMDYWSSELLQFGVTEEEISNSIVCAVAKYKVIDFRVESHFQFCQNYKEGVMIPDCKLSRRGLFMVIMNFHSNTLAVTLMQECLIKKLLEEKKY